jgi:hypothetical protein
LLVACPGNPPEDPDGGTSGDGLTVLFTGAQTLPAPDPAIDRTVTEVKLQAESITAIGDNAPGDDRTTRLDAELRWRATDVPGPIRYEDAPAGLYSRVEVRLLGEGDDHSFEIKGEALYMGMWRPYELEADTLMTIVINTSTALPPGGSATIDVPVDLVGIVAGVDFAQCTLNGEDKLECDSQEAAVAAAVVAAFGDGVTVTE